MEANHYPFHILRPRPWACKHLPEGFEDFAGISVWCIPLIAFEAKQRKDRPDTKIIQY